MIGKYYINGQDAFTVYGLAFNPGTYNELLKLPKRKEGYSKNWNDENGTERDVNTIYFESRLLSLPITILANSEVNFYNRYNALKAFLFTAGYFNFDVVDMDKRFRLLYHEMSNFTKITQIKDNEDICCEFTLQLIDDFPTTNFPIV